MFEKIVDDNVSDIWSKLNNTDSYIESLLNNDDLPSVYKNMMNAERDIWIYKELLRLHSLPFFKFQPQDDFFFQYEMFLKNNSCMPFGNTKDFINSIVKLRLNYLLRPRTTLKFFIFKESLTVSNDEFLKFFAFFPDYDYFYQCFYDYLANKIENGQNSISVFEFEQVIDSIDKKHLFDMDSESFIELLNPMFEFFNLGYPSEINLSMPKEALVIFFDDKKMIYIADIINKYHLNSIDRNTLLNILSDALAPDIATQESAIDAPFAPISEIPIFQEDLQEIIDNASDFSEELIIEEPIETAELSDFSPNMELDSILAAMNELSEPESEIDLEALSDIMSENDDIALSIEPEILENIDDTTFDNSDDIIDEDENINIDDNFADSDLSEIINEIETSSEPSEIEQTTTIAEPIDIAINEDTGDVLSNLTQEDIYEKDIISAIRNDLDIQDVEIPEVLSDEFDNATEIIDFSASDNIEEALSNYLSQFKEIQQDEDIANSEIIDEPQSDDSELLIIQDEDLESFELPASETDDSEQRKTFNSIIGSDYDLSEDFDDLISDIDSDTDSNDLADIGFDDEAKAQDKINEDVKDFNMSIMSDMKIFTKDYEDSDGIIENDLYFIRNKEIE